MKPQDSAAFDFGRNWEAFSERKLDISRLVGATQSLVDLIGKSSLRGMSFLDIGCGSGIFSIAAAHLGAAPVIGFDISPVAISVAKRNGDRFADYVSPYPIPDFRVGSALDEAFLNGLKTFDIVYAWGSLHHTGQMWRSIRNAASAVKPHGGLLVIAIYQRHWTSPIWSRIKLLYNIAPPALRRLLKLAFTAIIFVGASITTGGNPLKKERGMDFVCDVEDWLGGYPYEFAGVEELSSFISAQGLGVEKVVKTKGWTGCNELVCRRLAP